MSDKRSRHLHQNAFAGSMPANFGAIPLLSRLFARARRCAVARMSVLCVCVCVCVCVCLLWGVQHHESLVFHGRHPAFIWRAGDDDTVVRWRSARARARRGCADVRNGHRRMDLTNACPNAHSDVRNNCLTNTTLPEGLAPKSSYVLPQNPPAMCPGNV